MTRINNCACFFLVALRLVIGWHFFIEGAYKLNTHRKGKSSTNVPWSSEGFFREGYGPAADASRALLEIDDERQLARLRLVDDHTMAPDLEDEWSGFFSRYLDHYALTDGQKRSAQDVYRKHKDSLMAWLAGLEATDVKKPVLWGTADMKLTLSERMKDYEEKRKEIADAFAQRLPAFNKDVEKSRLRTLKADAAKLLADMSNDLDARNAKMRESLNTVLTDAQRNLGPVAETKKIPRLTYMEWSVMWSHLVLGLLLMFGLFSRLSCLLLAGFLLHITLIAPALPFAPTPPGAIGHYQYINLYVIEMVALLALACMPTGRWFGLDTLWSAFRTRRQSNWTPHAASLAH